MWKEGTIWIDEAKIARVIDNLISNAIKYNKRSGEIALVLKEECLMISDTGIGIEKEKISAMFERYSRFNSTEGGFGIGLNIVKSILDEYKLEVEVNSVIKMGTTIKIHLPKRKKHD